MEKSNFYTLSFFKLVLFLISGISLTSFAYKLFEAKEQNSPKIYIKKEQPNAIYITGKKEPVLRIDDLPKEFPPQIHHPEGARFPDTRFNLVALSPDGQRIAFSCGDVHEWVGVYELKSKKIHVVSWLFETHVDQILWSSNSQYFTYTDIAPSGENFVSIVAFKGSATEPHIANWWSSGIDSSGLVSNLQWSPDNKSLQFEIQEYDIKDNKIMKKENGWLKVIALNVIKEEVKEKPKEIPKKKTKQ